MNKLLRKIIIASFFMISTTAFVQGSDWESYDQNCCSYDGYCGTVFLDAEALWWRAFERGLSDACDNIKVTNTTIDDFTTSRLEGKSHSLPTEWDWGFRVGLGYEPANNDWNFSVYWTYFYSNPRGRDRVLNWKLDFNTVDLFCCYDYDWSPCIALNPYLGIRYVQINQHLSKKTMSTVNLVSDFSRVRIRKNFWGVGPVMGAEANVGLACGFCFFGNIAVGVLYGDYDVNSRNRTYLQTGIYIDHLRDHNHNSQIILDLGLGVSWSRCFCQNYILGFQLGVEEHRYFNHNQFRGCGDLSLAGLNLGISLEF